MSKILIVGYGSIGKRHMRNILSKKNMNIIICSKRRDLKFQEKNIKVVKTVDQGIAEKPDMAFVTNETSYHISVATKLANAGIHLFIEKPLSSSENGVKQLKKIIKNKGIITLIGCDHRFHPCLKKIKEIIDKKRLGRIMSVQVESSSLLSDWHPYEDYRKGYSAKEELGGGIAMTMTHELDFLRWFFGEIKEIFSITKKISELEITADDISTMTMIFKNNIIGELHLDYFARPQFKSCKIRSTKGTLYWNSDENSVKIFYNKQNKWKTVFQEKKFDRNQMFVKELEYFLKCVKNREHTFNDINDGEKIVQVILGAKKSSRMKKVVHIKN